MPKDYITITQFNEFKEEMLEFKELTTKIVSDMHTAIDEMKSMLKVTIQLLTTHVEQSEVRWSDQRQINQDVNDRIIDLEATIG